MKDIIIEYQLISDNTWKRITLKPKDYFGEDEINYSIGTPGKYFLEPRNYVSGIQSQISVLKFYLNDENGNEVFTKFTFWEDGLSEIKDHSNYCNGTLEYRTIINSIRLDDKTTLVLRLEEIDGHLIPITQLIMDDEADVIVRSIDLSIFKRFRPEMG